jgi:hypothetical protein
MLLIPINRISIILIIPVRITGLKIASINFSGLSKPIPLSASAHHSSLPNARNNAINGDKITPIQIVPILTRFTIIRIKSAILKTINIPNFKAVPIKRFLIAEVSLSKLYP